MKVFIASLVLLFGTVHVKALVIHEIMSNPIGSDNGREWVELYNETSDPLDIGSFVFSTSEGGAGSSFVSLQGGTIVPPGGYAVVATIVSGQTKFLEDYPSYAGILLRVSSSFSFTNSSTALYVRSGTSLVASIPSYTAADEGKTLSYVGGGYVTGNPTPGASNEAYSSSETPVPAESATTTLNQVIVPQLTPPSPDIVIYLPDEKIVVAGAETEFAVTSHNRAGKELTGIHYTWAFGDGGSSTGSSTKYRYAYTGRYIAVVQATSQTVSGSGRMRVRVIPPDLAIQSVGTGKYGSYVDISNQNTYDVDLSQWALTLDGSGFVFPKNTIIPSRSVIRLSGLAMGFASTTISASTSIKIIFPNLEEVTRYVPSQPVVASSSIVVATATPVKVAVRSKPLVLGAATTTKAQSTTTLATSTRNTSKDTRLVQLWRRFFGGK